MTTIDRYAIEGVEFAHCRPCDVCGERSRPDFDAHDPRTKQNYSFCSKACIEAFDRGLKVAQRIQAP